MSKIRQEHLSRKACVYVRQSSMNQVMNNLESQRLQYSLRERAQSLGWREVEVIDEDLGKSGAGTAERNGFEGLLSEVCAGLVGAVFAFDASRLARNGREWHTLIELCGLMEVLIIDQDSTYDVREPNDRLLLGMKGTMSEMEIGLFRQRTQTAIQEKAKRGELYSNIVVGYVRDDAKNLVKDSNRRVQKAIELVFRKFHEFGSARQVCLWCRQEEVELPVVPLHSKGYCIEWRLPAYNAVVGILNHPIYAGAYTYGRTKSEVVIKDGRKHVRSRRSRNPEDWDVLLREHHEGYISWEDFMTNQKQLACNNSSSSKITGGAAKKGVALLSGILRCGHCGQRMYVAYGGKGGQSIRYYCLRDAKQGAPTCFSLRGALVDGAVSQALLETLSPLALNAAMEAYERLLSENVDLVRHHELKLEQARYEAERMRRQYDTIEPENRLVAAELESRWNKALEAVKVVEKELEADRAQHAPLTTQDREQILLLADDLSKVWKHPLSDAELKTRIVRTVLREVIVRRIETENTYHEKIQVLLHWQGGDHSELFIKRKRRAKNGAVTNAEVTDLVAQLARVMNDRGIAALFNRIKKRTARGNTWSQARVTTLRRRTGIPAYVPGERQERGELTLDEAADMLDTYRNKVKRLIDSDALPAKQACSHAPWIVKREDVERLKCNQAARCGLQSQVQMGFADSQPQ